ncbi:MAG: cytochrome c oxidase assembly protein [Dehalococcoidia bacterium]
MRVQRTVRYRLLAIAFAAFAALAPVVALAHGENAPKPNLSALLTRWEFDPLFILASGFASWWYIATLRAVNRKHPTAPWPRKRTTYFFLGVGTMAFAVMSPPASYDGVLFSVHMWQHIIIMMISAPLILLGTPITLLLRSVSSKTRREVLIPILHSGPVRVITFPVLSWLIFTVTLWGSHYSPLFNAALEHEWLHWLEHFMYLTAALMFWWQAIGVDPTPWRMPHPVRILYLFLQMPQNTFLALSIYDANHVLYRHYETTLRTWGPSPLGDQQLAGITMWVLGDILFLTATGIVAAGWLKHEEREGKRQDRILARERSAAAATTNLNTP